MKIKNIFLIAFSFILLSQFLSAQCFQDRHHTSPESAWESCTANPNINTSRGTGHWILYNLGANYDLGQLHFWNYNIPGETNKGMKNIIIDYSTNATNWGGGVTFRIDQAPGSGFYEGQAGPQLSGVTARYVLITALDNHGGSCTGLSEVRIGIYEDPCTDLVKQIDENPIINGLYHATQSINSMGLVNATSDVEFVAGQQIELEVGFESKMGSEFYAHIEGCP